MLSAERIKAGLDTEFIGQSLVYLPGTGSTNDGARRLAQEGAPAGTLVITDYQATGRGRLDRRWVAPSGSSLLMSLIFRPPLAPHQVQRLTMVCGLAVADAVESETGLQVDLKWPNDVLIEGAKVCGLLTEVGLSGDQVDYVVVGIGLNVNLDPEQLPERLLMPATSLSHVLGRKVARLPLLQALLRMVERRYLALEAGHSPRAEWAARLVTLGQSVVVVTGDKRLAGVAEGVNANGALLVRRADGGVETVVAGDVTLCPPGHSAPA
jgi:BirA family biotin operon repressor/biotin-[acetyl-CoA-carboxylase] ligase